MANEIDVALVRSPQRAVKNSDMSAGGRVALHPGAATRLPRKIEAILA